MQPSLSPSMIMSSFSCSRAGACVEAYQVTSFPSGDLSNTQKLRTKALNATAQGLAAGTRYTFYVKALWGGGRGGGKASVQATPARACTKTAAPSAPTNVTARPLPGGLELCFGAPENAACVSEVGPAAAGMPIVGFKSLP